MTDWWRRACLAAACVQLLHSAGLGMFATSWERMHTGGRLFSSILVFGRPPMTPKCTKTVASSGMSLTGPYR